MPATRTSHARDDSTKILSTHRHTTTADILPKTKKHKNRHTYVDRSSGVRGGRITEPAARSATHKDIVCAGVVDHPRFSPINVRLRSCHHRRRYTPPPWDIPDIWGHVAEHLSSPADLAALSRVNRNANYATLPHLYRRPLIMINEHERVVVDNLCSPQNAGLRHIKHLTLAPLITRDYETGTIHPCEPATLHYDVIHKILRTLPFMSTLQSLALCASNRTMAPRILVCLDSHGLTPYLHEYNAGIIPPEYYDHRICFDHNPHTWEPRYAVWAVDAEAKCAEFEQRTLFESKLSKCVCDGVKDTHTLAWRTCD